MIIMYLLYKSVSHILHMYHNIYIYCLCAKRHMHEVMHILSSAAAAVAAC